MITGADAMSPGLDGGQPQQPDASPADQSPADLNGRLSKADLVSADGEAFSNPTSGRKHHQRQIRQAPQPRRLT